MIIDIKYHITSLVAIFLALAIGILVGTSIIGNDGLRERQEQIITALEQDFAQLRKDNQEQQEKIRGLNQEIQRSQRFEKAVLPSLIAGRLVGRNIAVIETGNNYIPKQLVDAIKFSGGNIRSTTVITPKMFDANELEQDDLLTLLGEEIPEEKEMVPKAISRAIGEKLIGSNNSDLTNKLIELGLIEVKGDYSRSVETVILIGGSEKENEGKIKKIDIPLVRALQNRGIRVIGTEFSTDKYSYMHAYQKENMTTIDNIDTIPGQLSLILTLQGKKGHFGFKESAQKLIPSLKW